VPESFIGETPMFQSMECEDVAETARRDEAKYE
jgi:hypothetical protein